MKGNKKISKKQQLWLLRDCIQARSERDNLMPFGTNCEVPQERQDAYKHYKLEKPDCRATPLALCEKAIENLTDLQQKSICESDREGYQLLRRGQQGEVSLRNIFFNKKA